MTRCWTATRRTFLQGSAATGLLLAAPPVIGQARIKVAGIHGSPVENAWNSRLHGAMMEAAADGSIDYVFSEGVAGTDYVRANERDESTDALATWHYVHTDNGAHEQNT